MKNLSEVDKKLKNVFAHIFQLQNKDINNSSSMKNIEKWDSLNHIGLINEIEEKFNLQFNEEDIVKMINFKIIFNKIINIKRKKT